MPRGRPPTAEAKTAFAQFVFEFRRAGKLTQEALGEKILGADGKQVPKSYISHLETGGVLRPHKSVLESFSRLTGRSVSELEQMTDQPVDSLLEDNRDGGRPGSTGYLFTIAFGHCLWASPIPVAIGKGLLPHFQSVSFSDARDSQPVFLDAKGFSKVLKESGRLPGNSSTDRSISARDALEMLERKQVDFAAVPGNLIGDDLRSWALQVGTIVDSSSGCTLVCNEAFYNSLKEFRTSKSGSFVAEDALLSIPSKNLGAALSRMKSQPTPLLAVEPGTVAEDILDDALGDLEPNDARKIWGTIRHEFMNSQIGTSEFQQEIDRWIDDRKQVGIITWQPHASWVSKGRLSKEIQIPFSRGVDGRPHHLTFEIVMRLEDAIESSVRTRQLRLAVYDLMNSLSDVANTLNAIDSTSRTYDKTAVSIVSQYFNLHHSGRNTSNQEMSHGISGDAFGPAIRAIGAVRYSVKWNMSALELMKFKPA